MSTLHAYQSAMILRRLAEIEVDATVILAAIGGPHIARAHSIRTSAQMAREELLRAVLTPVTAEPVALLAAE